MSNFLQSLIDAAKPQPKTIRLGGAEQTVYFRRLTAGERIDIVRGQKITHNGGQMEIELDLAANEKQKILTIKCSACTEDGAPLFQSVREIERLPAQLAAALFKAASEVNADDSEVETGNG